MKAIGVFDCKVFHTDFLRYDIVPARRISMSEKNSASVVNYKKKIDADLKREPLCNMHSNIYPNFK